MEMRDMAAPSTPVLGKAMLGVKPYRSIDPFYPIVPDAAWVGAARGGRRAVHPAALQGLVTRGRCGRRSTMRWTPVRPTQAELVVNDYWDLAIEAGATYVHLGQTDLDDGRRLGSAPAATSASASARISHDELERALATDPDYVALGPIYPTTLKQMPWAPQGLERIGEWKRLIGSRPLVAIGGITLERVPLCLEAGADSVAVVSDIYKTRTRKRA